MEITSNEAQRVLKLIGDGIEGGREFVIEQAPPVVQEIVTYGRTLYTAWMIIGLVAAVSAWLVIRIGLSSFRKALGISVDSLRGQEQQDWYGALGIACALVGTAAAFFGLMLTIHNLPEFCRAWFAPRLYVLKTLIELAR